MEYSSLQDYVKENYNRLSLSQTFKVPGDLFEIEKVRDIENLTK